MEPISIATTISVVFFTKAMEKMGAPLSEATLVTMKQAMDKLWYHAPEVAGGIESFDKHILSLHEGLLSEMIPTEPIFGTFLAAAEVEPNLTFQAKLPDVKAGKILQILRW
jgi:hypothetical protein